MKISDDFIKEKVKDECVLIPTGLHDQNAFFNLNETAERIFDLVSEGYGFDEIVTTLCEEYEIDRRKAEQSTDTFISALREAGIILDD